MMMSPKRYHLGMIFLVHCAFAVSTALPPARFADTLDSFTDPGGRAVSSAVVDPNSGDVYVAAGSALHHLSPDLELKQTVKVTDEVDENIHLKWIESPPALLICGSAFDGLCQIRPTSNLTDVDWIRPHNNVPGYYPGWRYYSATFLHGHNEHNRHNGEWTMFTAHAGGDTQTPILSSKVLVKDKEGYHFRYPLPDDRASSHFMPVNTSLEDVADGFEHNGYIYFMTNLKRNGRTQATLLRFSADDPTFQSYAELPFIWEEGDKHCLRFSAAHFGDSYDHPRNEKELYLAFHPVRDDDERSFVSSFEISWIIRAFNAKPKNCSREYFGEKCDVEGKKNCRILCGSNGFPYVAVDNLSASFHRLLPVPVTLRAFAPIRQDGRTVIVGLGSDGSVLKRSPYSGKIFYLTSLMENPSLLYPQTCIFTKERTHIYFRISTKVIKFPVSSCGVHETESLCLTKGKEEPLHCGWCGDRCTTRDQCSEPASFYAGKRRRICRCDE